MSYFEPFFFWLYLHISKQVPSCLSCENAATLFPCEKFCGLQNFRWLCSQHEGEKIMTTFTFFGWTHPLSTILSHLCSVSPSVCPPARPAGRQSPGRTPKCSAGPSEGTWSGPDSPPGWLQSPSAARSAPQEKAWPRKLPDLQPYLSTGEERPKKTSACPLLNHKQSIQQVW